MVENNDEGAKRRATVAFMEGLDELCNQVNKDYKELLSLSLSLSLEDILKKVKKYKFNHESQWNKLENELFIPYKLADRIDICKARQQIVFSDSGRGLTSISLALKIIKNNTCNQCENQLNKDSCFVYYWKSKKNVKWTIEQAKNFNLEDFRILFCSEDCFKESNWYQVNKQSSIHTHTAKREREREQNNNSSSNQSPKPQPQTNQQPESEEYQEPSFCSCCAKEIPLNSTYYSNPHQNDNEKLCSKECYLNFYGKNCDECKNKFLTLYPDENYPSLVYCLNCLNKLKTENIKHCQFCNKQLIKEESLIQYNNEVCHQDECLDKYWENVYKESSNNNLNLDSEQNRTEQNRTEQNRTEQNRTEQNRTEQNRTEQNAGNSTLDQSELTNQINNLKKEINQLEKQSFVGDQNSSNPQPQNLLNFKKNELRNLENKLRESNQPTEQEGNNSKLILGAGMGICGLGLIGLIVYLVRRKE